MVLEEGLERVQATSQPMVRLDIALAVRSALDSSLFIRLIYRDTFPVIIMSTHSDWSLL